MTEHCIRLSKVFLFPKSCVVLFAFAQSRKSVSSDGKNSMSLPRAYTLYNTVIQKRFIDFTQKVIIIVIVRIFDLCLQFSKTFTILLSTSLSLHYATGPKVIHEGVRFYFFFSSGQSNRECSCVKT